MIDGSQRPNEPYWTMNGASQTASRLRNRFRFFFPRRYLTEDAISRLMEPRDYLVHDTPVVCRAGWEASDTTSRRSLLMSTI
jgi:hypothetical protein